MISKKLIKILQFILLTSLLTTPLKSAPKKELTIVAQLQTAWNRNFNPYLEVGRLHTTRHFMYEPLVVFNDLQGGKPEFRLATEFKFSKDLKNLTFTLREGVKWSDGQSFTADDVIYSFQLIKKHKALDNRSIWKWLESVKKISSHKIQFNLNSINTDMPYELSLVPVVSKKSWEKIEKPVSYTNPNPVGTGPFTEISHFSPQLYTQCKNPHYWQAKNLKIDCLKMPQYSNNDQILAAAKNGKLDWFGSFIPNIDKLYVGSDRKNHKYWFPPSGTVAFNVNFATKQKGNNKAFNHISFRRAFSMALDREAMVTIAGYGYPTINDYASGIGKTFQTWADDTVENKYKVYNQFDIKKAKKLLLDAGFKDSDKDGFLNNPDGSKISFKVLVPNGWTDWVNTVQIGIEGLNALGIDAKISTPEAAVWTQKLMDGDFDVALQGYFAGGTPYKYFETGFHSRHMGVKGNRFAANRFKNKELDSLIDSFIQTENRAERKKIISKISKIVAENQVVMPVFNNPTWYEYNTKRFKGWFHAGNPLAKPQVHPDTPERLLHVLNLEAVAH